MDETSIAAGAGLTSVILAVIYGLQKLIRRSRCASHTKCCDLDVARSETHRDKASLEMTILEILKQRDIKKTAFQREDSEEKADFQV